MQNRIMLSGLLALAIMGITPALCEAAAQQNKEVKMAQEQPAAPATAGAPRERGPKGPQMTPEQRQKMEAAFAQYAEKIQPLEDQLFVKKQELRALQNAPQPDVNAVGAKAAEIVKLRRQLDTLHREMAKEAGLPAPAWRGANGPCGGPAWGGPCGGPGFGPKHGRRGHGPRNVQPCPGAEL